MILIYILQCGETPLHVAAEYNCNTVAELLIRSGADVDAKDEVGTSLICILIL